MRGKHQKKALKRRVALAQERLVQSERLAAYERRLLTDASQQREELDALVTDLKELRGAVIETTRAECQRLAFERLELEELAEVLEGQEAEAKRPYNGGAIRGIGLSALEAIIADQVPGATITEGVHLKRGMTTDAVRAIQRARRVR